MHRYAQALNCDILFLLRVGVMTIICNTFSTSSDHSIKRQTTYIMCSINKLAELIERIFAVLFMYVFVSSCKSDCCVMYTYDVYIIYKEVCFSATLFLKCYLFSLQRNLDAAHIRVGKNSGPGDRGSRDPLVTSVLWNYTRIYTFLHSCYIPLLHQEVNACSQLMLVLAASSQSSANLKTVQVGQILSSCCCISLLVNFKLFTWLHLPG